MSASQLKFKKYFKTQEDIINVFLTEYLGRKPLKIDIENTMAIQKEGSCIFHVHYKKVLIGKFANKL